MVWWNNTNFFICYGLSRPLVDLSVMHSCYKWSCTHFIEIPIQQIRIKGIGRHRVIFHQIVVNQKCYVTNGMETIEN